MGTLITCDICLGAMKCDKPVYLELSTSNSAFVPNKTHFITGADKYEEEYELCVECARRLVATMKAARDKCLAELDSLKVGL